MAHLEKQGERWHVKFYYGGRPYKRTLGDLDHKQARIVKQRVELKLSQTKAGLLLVPSGVDVGDFIVYDESTQEGQRKRAPSILLAELIRAFEDRVRTQQAPSTFATTKIHLAHFKRIVDASGRTRADIISPRAIEQYTRARLTRDRVSKTTVNKELQTIKQLFDYGVELGYVADCPVKRGMKFKGAGGPHRFLTKAEIDELTTVGLSKKQMKELKYYRYLTPEEVARLLSLASGSYLYVALAILAYTGMRRGELLKLSWTDIDLRRGLLWVQSRKQSRENEFKGREITIHSTLLSILKELRRGSRGPYLLPGREDEPVSAHKAYHDLKKLTRGTEFEGIGFHTLRHTFSSNLASAGVDDRTIDAFMGHETEEMRKRYQHLFPEKRRGAIEALPY